MNIVIFGDISSKNLGDPILTNSAEYIVRQCFDDETVFDTIVVDIMDRKKYNFSASINALKKSTYIKRFFKPIFLILIWYFKNQKSYEKRLIDSVSNSIDNIFLIAGGALLSNSLPYALRLGKIVSFANKNNIPVIFNAVGIEKSVRKGISRFFIRKILKSASIKSFATRDNIDEILFLTNRKEFYKKNCDPGIFASEAYNVTKKQSQTVGIGVISSEAYKSIIGEKAKALYATEDCLIDFWHSVILELEKNKVEWKIFTNGGEKDYSIACKLIEKYGYQKDKLTPQPKDPKELVEQISGFSAVIAHRLHALIVSSSLQIPVIPLVWSSKIKEFAKVLNISDIAFWPDNDKAPIIVDKLMQEDFYAIEDKILKLKRDTISHLKDVFSGLEINND